MKILIILALLVIPVSAQTPTPDYDAVLKRLTEQVEQLEKKAAESQKAYDQWREIERIVRESGVTAPRERYNPRPRYYPTSRYYPRLSLRYYPAPYYPAPYVHTYYPRLFRGSTIYRNYHR